MAAKDATESAAGASGIVTEPGVGPIDGGDNVSEVSSINAAEKEDYAKDKKRQDEDETIAGLSKMMNDLNKTIQRMQFDLDQTKGKYIIKLLKKSSKQIRKTMSGTMKTMAMTIMTRMTMKRLKIRTK